ncbi:MarR family winged helix-turn-helix transcriptional regulator [Cellulomonas gilvus]|uniref:Regulatory protein MarR n=1 Tax=Cellulomonas gilvus (strain ATCC 13127 / NRRL B-14078) TaxID=593907 RepID=F8A0T8_CELGA|nr:MarR family winged helix-turn-helix transcriptional regulator [Cellulomonas gilvus]AEI11560.1 regulatory protein MarR [Cellulomonas gilvus ATCC 13127]
MTERAGRRATAREAAAAWESLFRAQVALMRRFTAQDVWGELTVREYDVLFALSGRPDGAARLHELAAESLLTQPSLSRLVERLETRGWVRRSPAPQDGRGVVVTLTEEGAALQREVGRRHVAQIHRLVGGVLDADELATLRDLTDRLRTGQARIP